MTPQDITSMLDDAYKRGYHQGYQAGHKEGSLTPAQRTERAEKMQSMTFKRLADVNKSTSLDPPANQSPCQSVAAQHRPTAA